MSGRRGFTTVELLVALGIFALVMGIGWGILHQLFSSKSRSNLTGMTRRSYLQKDAKAGLRRLQYRLRESIQVTNPLPGLTSDELDFRDINNNQVRVRYVAAQHQAISERSPDGVSWTQETQPDLVAAGSGQVPTTWPIRFNNVLAIHFTAFAADCVTVQATLQWEGENGSLLQVIKLRNSGQAY